jgi:hypothetical protein
LERFDGGNEAVHRNALLTAANMIHKLTWVHVEQQKT